MHLQTMHLKRNGGRDLDAVSEIEELLQDSLCQSLGAL